MVGGKTEGLTEDETALYDRQIRLWGYEAQFKLKHAKVLVVGVDGLGAEIVKNIVLSGVQGVCLADSQTVTEEDFDNQFFLSSETALNKNRGEASLQRASALNPLVQLTAETEQPILEKSEEFFGGFQMVVSCNLSPQENVKLNPICRKQNVPFIAAGVFGTFGYAFYDFNKHKFTKSSCKRTWKGEVRSVSFEEIAYPSFSSALNETPLNTPGLQKLLKKVPPSIYLLKVLLQFFEEFGRKPSERNEEDYTKLLKIRESVLKDITLPQGSFPVEVLRSVCCGMPSPICALLGAIVSQEIVKGITGKGEPHRNLFFFDPIKLSGHVQYIGPETSPAGERALTTADTSAPTADTSALTADL